MSFEPRDLQADATAAPATAEEAARYAETLRQLAVFQMAHGVMETAERLTRIALWMDRKSAASWRLRANCLARMNNPREALKLLSRAKSEGVPDIGLRDLLAVGFAFARAGFLDDARRIFNASQ